MNAEELKSIAPAWALPALEKIETRNKGKRGICEKRDRLAKYLRGRRETHEHYSTDRRAKYNSRMGRYLARQADLTPDGHGSGFWADGGWAQINVVDYISPYDGSAQAPYYDLGGMGLALVSIARTRNYAKSCRYRSSTRIYRYLVGRNETGTFFAHPVNAGCATVLDAINWMWSNKAAKIIARQGDIALVEGRGNYTLPQHHIHYNYCNKIIHPTHPSIPAPQKGQTIIIARRSNNQIGRGRIHD